VGISARLVWPTSKAFHVRSLASDRVRTIRLGVSGHRRRAALLPRPTRRIAKTLNSLHEQVVVFGQPSRRRHGMRLSTSASSG
jgi:hypothetical protein